MSKYSSVMGRDILIAIQFTENHVYLAGQQGLNVTDSMGEVDDSDVFDAGGPKPMLPDGFRDISIDLSATFKNSPEQVALKEFYRRSKPASFAILIQDDGKFTPFMCGKIRITNNDLSSSKEGVPLSQVNSELSKLLTSRRIQWR